MSESLNILKTGRYEVSVKVGLVTVPTEADRQQEEWNLSNEAQRSLRKVAGLNKSEPIIGSVVIRTSSNGVNECADPVRLWRRQNHAPAEPVWVHGHSGVTGQACGEGYSRENGRSCIPPVRGMECMKLIKSSKVSSYHALHSPEVNLPISGSEEAENGEQEVGQDHSSDELPVMGMDAKDPDFCNAFRTVHGYQSYPTMERKGIEHEREGQSTVGNAIRHGQSQSP